MAMARGLSWVELHVLLPEVLCRWDQMRPWETGRGRRVIDVDPIFVSLPNLPWMLILHLLFLCRWLPLKLLSCLCSPPMHYHLG